MVSEARVVTTVVDRGTSVVQVTGDVDEDSAPLLEEAFSRATAGARPRTIVDLSGVDFADSSVLHVLLRAQRTHRAADGSLVLAGPFSTTVERLFVVTGTEAFFDIVASREAAVSRLGAPRDGSGAPSSGVAWGE
ncbi:STAS domain-containing protein [Streptomyces sp. NPDC002004]